MSSLRISSLPRANVCPASLVTKDESGVPNVSSDASRMGDAFHKVMELRCHGEPLIGTYMRDIAREYGVPMAELDALVGNSTFDPCRPGAETEVAVELELDLFEDGGEDIVPGHVDWSWIDHANKLIHVFDYKTTAHPEGATPVEQDAQLMAYGLAMAQRHIELINAGYLVQVTKHYPRAARQPADGEMGQYESVTLDHAKLLGVKHWLGSVVRRSMEQYQKPVAERQYGVNNFSPATSCGYCSAAATCPAWKAKLGGLVEWGGGTPLTEDQFRETFKRLEAFSGLSDRRDDFRKMLTAKIDQHGPLSLDETHEVFVAERRIKSKVARFPMVRRKELANAPHDHTA